VKPSGNCIKEIKSYYNSLNQSNLIKEGASSSAPQDQNISGTQMDHRLVVVGDRLLTDVLMANEMRAYSIWTTRLWKKNFESIFWRIVERSWLGVARSVVWWKTRGERRKSLEAENKELKSDTGLEEIHARGLRRETNARLER
jgi:hypothetical protein